MEKPTQKQKLKDKFIPRGVMQVLVDTASKIDWDSYGSDFYKAADALNLMAEVRKSTKKDEARSQFEKYWAEITEAAIGAELQVRKQVLTSLYLECVLGDQINGVKVLDPAKPYSIKDIAEAKKSRGLKGRSEKQIKAHLKALKIKPMQVVDTQERPIGGQPKFYRGSDVRAYVIGELNRSGIERQKKAEIKMLLDKKPHIQTNKDLKSEMGVAEAQKETIWYGMFTKEDKGLK